MRVIVSISSREYQRNIIESGSLDELVRAHKVDFVAPLGVVLELPTHFRNCKVYYFSLNARNEYSADFQMEINTRNKRYLSSSFKYRSIRKYSNLKFFLIKQLGFENEFVDTCPRKICNVRRDFLVMIKNKRLRYRKLLLADFYYFLRNKGRQFLVYILGSSLMFPLFNLVYKKQNRVNKDLLAIVQWQEYDFVVHISSAYDRTGSELVRIANQYSISSVFVIDNWDNLSSKTVLRDLPDFVIVWGEQSRRHAIEIQGFDSAQVFSLGSARFQEYFTARNLNLVSHFNHPYVLFAGTFLPFDEIACLELLDTEIKGNKNIYGDLKIVYRPHPLSHENHAFEFIKKDFQNVIIDSQIVKYNSSPPNLSKSNRNLPKLDYSPSLIKNSEFLVGGLTSMLIEASIFFKTYLALVYDEPLSVTSPRRVFREYVHFEQVENLPNVVLIHERQKLVEDFRHTYLSCHSLSRENIDKNLTYFVEINENETFGTRLKRQLESLQRSNS